VLHVVERKLKRMESVTRITLGIHCRINVVLFEVIYDALFILLVNSMQGCKFPGIDYC